jgi:hypothetical protein
MAHPPASGGKQKIGKREEEEMEFQDAKRALKAVYHNSDSESSSNERHKTLHVMFGGSRHLHQKSRRTSSGWRRRLGLTPLIAPRAW